jgi:predicted O-linked N-acetylglucosamine transferase (SPINDLY family)
LIGTVDIALDTSPYSGGTTTCDALWMGVPVITEPDARSVSRSTASILSTLGLRDWIAEPQQYVSLAAAKARDPAGLAQLRAGLRARMHASPLMDEVRFTRGLEAAYRSMGT